MSVLNITKIALAWELHLEGIPETHIALRAGVNRVTIWRWLKEIHQVGELALFLEKYQMAKRGTRKKRKIDAILKRQVWTLREDHRDCCGQKIKYFLKQSFNVELGTTTIYKILSEKYQLRTRWKKNQKRGPVPQALIKRQVVQMDSVDFGNIFAFTAIDIFTRETDVLLRPSLEAVDGQFFLQTTMERRFNNFSQIIQTDGGPEFKAEFHQDTINYCNWHRFARPYKKNEQSYIESFNRSLRKECLGWLKYKPEQMKELTKQVNNWLVYYHYQRPHIGLGMKPPLTKDQVLHI